MTRPTVRMCARCQRTTDEPVLVHEVHAATGPGFNVYACPECAPQYPPMTDPLEILDSAARRRSSLTLRVYKVDAEGAVTDAGRRVEVQAGGPSEPIPCSSAYPPCACPRCESPG
ncbi:hypothetical protein ACFWR9_26195 [Streptomyces sp. NPDC058534]|uniref:hypothetical protein n=1 Tax=Streptomyces sp. NPDC058534 TaxID=3346541 RepID=UPI00364B8213